MKLSELVVEGAIVPQLRSQERDAAIIELVDALIAAGAASPDLRDELITAVLIRESKSSTGFGKGVAVPHVKHRALTKLSAAIGLSARGIDFNALDRQPVHTVFLLLSPAHMPDEHLHAMEVIFTSLSKDAFRRVLRQSQTVAEVSALLAQADARAIG